MNGEAMRRAAVVIALGSAGVCLWTGIVRAQFGRGAGDYSTVGADAHRSSWVRTDPKISPDSVSRPGFELVWKVKLNNEARQLNALTPASLLNGYIGYRGFRSLALLGGSSNQVFAVDTDLGRVEWQQAIMTTPGPQGASSSCPGGMTANVARPVSAAFPAPPIPGRGGGRGSAAKSGVGEPNEGSVPLKEYLARMAAPSPPPPIPPAGAPGAGRGSLGGRGLGPAPGRMPNFVHSISSDGMFHSMYVSNGEEPSPPVKFLPPNANGEGLIVVDNAAYAVTTDGCGGAPNAIWVLDIASREVATWQPASGGIAGSEGPAFGPDGTVYVTTQSGDLAALEPKTLKLKDVFKAGHEFTTSPTVFQFDSKTMVAAATRDGGIYVLDGAVLSSGLAADVRFTGGALAAWQDAGGSRYLLATTWNAVMSWKLVAQGGSIALEKAWVSPEMVAPLTPLIVNGVVFAASSGEFVSDDAKITAARSVPAVVYALDGVTGKVLWNSGKAIASFVHGGGLSGGGSQVYLGTHDGTLYAFGFPIEH
jgi:outer membrane protein assembly factor BamB